VTPAASAMPATVVLDGPIVVWSPIVASVIRSRVSPTDSARRRIRYARRGASARLGSSALFGERPRFAN
jgi:hypothetical protein